MKREFSEQERREAYHRCQRARGHLNAAAVELGYDNIYQVMSEEADDEIREALQALTNAYSYLDNGQIEHLVKNE